MLSIFNKKDKKTVKKKPEHYALDGYDLDFIARIQPQGGIKFKERYVENGIGYQGCILLYDFPNDVTGHWLNSIINMEGTIGIVDYGTEDNTEVMNTLNRSVREQHSRILESKNALSRNEYQNTYRNLMDIGEAINQYGEVIKNMNIRLYITGSSQVDLDKKVSTIRKELQSKGFKGQMMMFESKDNYLSMAYSLTDQKKELSYYRKGKANVPASTAGASYYMNHTELMDPNGAYLGTTMTDGTVLLDMFQADSKRTYYNSIIFGAMGKGKSTLMKMLFEDQNARSHMIRGFDIAGDFREVVRYNGGQMISLSGSGGIINMLEVFATATTETEDEHQELVVDEKASFSAHLSKLKMQLKILNSDLTETDLTDYANWLREFYIDFGLLPNSLEEDYKVTGLEPKQYPILSDLLSFLESKNTDGYSIEKNRTLEKVISTIKEMVEQNGNLFNGHTTIPDILYEPIVFFDIKGLMDYGLPIFQTQIYTAISMIWSHALYHGQQSKKQIENPDIDNDTVQRFMVFIDECHNIINANNREVVQFTKNFMKEMRKYMAGIQLATQSPQELLPDGNELIVNDLKQIFELTQYKFLLGMDQSTLDKLEDVLGDTIKESEYELIPNLERGQAILSISGDSIVFNVMPTQEQLDRFEGGL